MPANRGSKLRVWENRSHSNPDKSYETIQWSNGEITCNCRGWIFPKNGNPRTCRHVRDVEVALMRPTPPTGWKEIVERRYRSTNVPIQGRAIPEDYSEAVYPEAESLKGVGIDFSSVRKQKIRRKRKSDQPIFEEKSLEKAFDRIDRDINPLFKKYRRMIRIASEE